MVSENQREDMRNFLVKAYADGTLDDSGLERMLTEMEKAESPEVLAAMVAEVRALYPQDGAAGGAGAPRDGSAGKGVGLVSKAVSAVATVAGGVVGLVVGAAPSSKPLPAAAPDAGGAPTAEDYQLVSGRGMSKRFRGRWFTHDRIAVDLDASTVSLDFSELYAFPGARIQIVLNLNMSTLKMIFPKGTEVQESVNNEWSSVRVRARGENAFSLVAYVSGSARMSTVKIKAR